MLESPWRGLQIAVGSRSQSLASQDPSGSGSAEEGRAVGIRGAVLRPSMLSLGSTTRFFNAKNSPSKQALMTTPHSQDMRGLRFRSTFSGAPLISFRRHHPCGAGPHGQQEPGVWGERAGQWGGRGGALDQVSETRW